MALVRKCTGVVQPAKGKSAHNLQLGQGLGTGKIHQGFQPTGTELPNHTGFILCTNKQLFIICTVYSLHKAENKTLQSTAGNFSLAVWFWQFWNISMSLRQCCNWTCVTKFRHLHLMDVCFLLILEKKKKNPSRIKLQRHCLYHRALARASFKHLPHYKYYPLQFSSCF